MMLFMMILLVLLMIEISNGFRNVGNKLLLKYKAALQATTDEMLSLQFIKSEIDKGPVPMKKREFRINGWRWHTQSVQRDLVRFEEVLKHEQELSLKNKKKNVLTQKEYEVRQKDLIERLTKCHSFVCNFSWKALMRVEKEIFYPWLRDILPIQSTALANEFTIMHELARKLSDRLITECTKVKHWDSTSYDKPLLTIQEMQLALNRSRKFQENVYVPFIASHIETREQEIFNRRVIRKLGVLESQIHLVGMRECITDNKNERKMFRQQIPKMVQTMIPAWKATAYTKLSSCLVQD